MAGDIADVAPPRGFQGGQAAGGKAAKQSMLDMGVPSWVAGALADYSVVFSNNYLDFFTDDVKNITGKSARTYKEFARDFVGAFT